MLRRKKAAGKDSIAKKKSTGTIDKEAEAQLLTNPMPFEKDCFFRLKKYQPFLISKVQIPCRQIQIFIRVFCVFLFTTAM